MNRPRFVWAPARRDRRLGPAARARYLACWPIWFLALALPAPLPAGEEPAVGPPAVAAAVRQAMQDRDYAAAIEAIQAASQVEDAPRDYLKYLEGRALALAGRHEEAVAAFGQLEREFPHSRWVRRARFAAAMAKARRGDFRGAEAIYRAEAEYLLGDPRKEQIANLYLELADAFFQPAEEDQPPDYTKALEGYQRALDAGVTGEKRIEVALRIARCHQELDQWDEAIADYTRFRRDYPETPQAVEAAYRLGQCQLEKGATARARRTWQDLLAEYPDSPSPRIADALYQLAETWYFPEPKNDHQLAAGAASLEAFLKRFPSHPRAGRAYLDLAGGYFHRGRQDEAIEVLRRFLEGPQYADRKEVPEALVLLGRSYQVQDRLTEALATWRRYLAEHPAHEDWGVVQRAVMATEYLMAEEAFQAEDHKTARQLWSEFLAKYPLDPRNRRIRLRFGTMYHREKQWAEALAEWRRAVSKYPDSPEAAEAQLAIAKTLEEDLGQFEEALEAYRQVPAGEQYHRAQQAIARLTAKSLVVAVDRVFRSDETPQIRVTTRNLDKLTCRLYPIDLETYFRKMHRADGIEQLDIALIDPETSFDFAVPDYQPYEERENLLDISVGDQKGPGATAVTVSGPTMEATALVLQSDLDLIIKSSPDEVFVFAENMRTMKPWPGVRLLLSNGARILAEGTTGEDGVFRLASAELQGAGQVRVFAVADGHVASNALGLDGIRVAQGLTDKGYLYTDRPVYRPGQQVHVRGCIRRAVEDAYRIEEGKPYTLEVLDSRNRLLWQQEVVLNDFGTFHAHFPVPPTGASGEYRVLVRDETGTSYQGQFRVHDYPVQPVRLLVESPRTVYYRGETIEGTIRAAYDYGTPLAGKEIRYRLADDRSYTAKTDADGLVRFRLPTRDFSQSQVLPLVVTLPERNLEVTRHFFLATQGFGIDVYSPRPVYLAGESFEVTARAYDAEGKPVRRKLALQLLKRTTVQGKVGQRQVQSHALETSAEEGIARKTLQIDEGGSYVVRVEGTDRFGQAVWGTLPLEISGDDDDVRLRILADRHTYHAGDTAPVTLHWREDPALALVTFQGARILDYQLLRLEKGANQLPVHFRPELAPNFELAVAVMTDARPAKPGQKPPRRFHEASSPFAVQRELKVAVSVKRQGDAAGPIRPGDPVEVTVTTTDPQGQPVTAEVSLAVLPTTQLDRFAWPIDPIDAFFRGAPREPAFRTTSSITFASRPETHAINARLLAEAERQEIARQEAARLPRGLGGGFGGAGGFGGSFGYGAGGAALGPPGPLPAGTLPIERGETAGDLFAEVTGQSEPAEDPESAQPATEPAADFSQLVDLIRSTPRPATEITRAEPVDRRPSVAVSQTQELPAAAAPEPQPAPAGGLSIDQTAYWNPAIVTGQDGRATVTLTLPPQSTAWTLAAKGITPDTLAGEATEELVVRQVKKRMAQIGDSDRRGKAVLLHALAMAGEGDFSVANRLHRERAQLGPEAVLYLALAFAAMDREATARELVERIRPPAQTDSAIRAADDWDAETWALYALALERLRPQAPQTKTSVQWLLAHRVGPRWDSDRATGPATLALCRWFASRRIEAQRYQIAVFVNDVQAAVLPIDGQSGTQEIAVPARLLIEGWQRINFQLTGRGRRRRVLDHRHLRALRDLPRSRYLLPRPPPARKDHPLPAARLSAGNVPGPADDRPQRPPARPDGRRPAPVARRLAGRGRQLRSLPAHPPGTRGPGDALLREARP